DGIKDCDTPGQPCDLRTAILRANANPGLDRIEFSIPGDQAVNGIYSLRLLTYLDDITDPVVIDGTTQPGYAGAPLIELNGAGLLGRGDALNVYGGGSTVRGLIINNFGCTAIALIFNGGNTIAGNYIGTDASGTSAAGNRCNGIYISSPNNTIGGPSPRDRNVISA